tara:strand:+ start:471 stop:2285 length:1815 start_codon:yes stop_codon:yes gene_type:complete
MALESGTYLDDLVNTNPTATDNVSQGDDHLRLIKKVLKNSFPSVDAAVNAIHTGTSAPSTAISAGLLWFDTTNNVLKLRNEANDAWITLPISPVTSNTVDVDGGAIDGTPIGAASASTGKFSSVNIAGDGATVTGIKDEDDMSSNSAVKLATQQSIKAYVDAQVTAQDLDLTTDSGSIDIDLDSETLTIAGGEGIDTSASSTTVTIAGEDASTSNKGIASFSSDNFSVSSGAVTIKDAGVANAELANMAANTVKVRDANSSGAPSDKAVADTQILIGDGTGFTAASVSGDATMTNAGSLTVTRIQGKSVSSNAPTNDQYLKYSSSSNEWQPVSVLSPDRLTTKGDLLVYNTVDSETRLPVGANGKFLQANSSATNGVSWEDGSVADEAITNAKLAHMAANTVKVRDANSSGDPTDKVVADTQILIGDGTGFTAAALSGDVTMANTGAVTLGTVAVAKGGTGSTSASAARTALGLAIGSDVQAFDSDTAKTDAAQTFTAGQRGEITSLTSGTTITIDMANSNNFSVTLAHNATFANPSNDTAGQSGSIFITQDGTGSRTASWGSDWDFAGGTAPTLSTTASAVDRIDYVILDASNIHAVATLNYS